MIRKSYGIIVSLVLIITIVVIIISNISKSPEKAIEECLSYLYNIADNTDYESLINDSMSDEDLFKHVLFDYEKYCTERGLNKIAINRIHLLYREAAYKKQFSVELKEITLEKSFEFTKEQKRGYNYTVMLNIAYNNTDKVEEVYEKGYINVLKVDNDWMIDSLGVKTIDDVFLTD